MLEQLHIEPALTVALALALGMIAQSLARHLGVPGIVVLLATGVLLGPDLLNIIRPHELDEALEVLVGFAVAIILFEGGLSLNLKQLRREARSIRRLVTFGAGVTAVGAALASHFILGWEWRTSFLFGTLVIVTGPTVINPLLRRIRVDRKLSTVLEAEGVFGDAVGAIVAVVAVELVTSSDSLAHGLGGFFERFVIGLVIGVAGGYFIALALRFERLIPEGLEAVFTLAVVLMLYQLSDALSSESGIVCVTIAGLVVGNTKSSEALHVVKEFKEGLTVLFIGMLFVLLAADVRLSEVRALGAKGLLTVGALMFVVRPLNILVGTWGAGFNLRERAFLSWLAPRGIVAAAVASLFAIKLDAAGIAGGKDLRALVFLVIAVTVTVQGLTGGLVATLLRVRPQGHTGFAVLGANPLGLAIARIIGRVQDVVVIDSNPENCKAVERVGLKVIYGNALDDLVLKRARLEEREGCIGVTGNESVNFVFARRARQEFRVPRVWVALRRDNQNVTPTMVERMGGRVLFGEPRHLDYWSHRLRGDGVVHQLWRCQSVPEQVMDVRVNLGQGRLAALPVAIDRAGKVLLLGELNRFRVGDELHLLTLIEGARSGGRAARAPRLRARPRARAGAAAGGRMIRPRRLPQPAPAGDSALSVCLRSSPGCISDSAGV